MAGKDMQCYCVMHHGQPLERVEKPIPDPQGAEVLVRVTAAGLCHSDLHLWEGGYDLGGGQRLSLADRGIKPPLTLCHEICGEIVSAGSDASEAKIGMRVLVHPWIGCGECKACRRGEENLCTKSQSLGVVRPGGFAEYVLVPHPRYLLDIEGLDEAEAAPLACAGVTTFSAIAKLGERIHEGPIVIIGAGGLGLMALAILKALNATGAIVVDIDARKREAALASGALAVIDGSASDAAKQIIEATGEGARAILDCVGASASLKLSIAASARAGHIVICGLIGGDYPLSLPVIPLRPLTIQGSYVGTLAELRQLLVLLKSTGERPIPVTRRPLADINAALRDLHDGKIVGRTVLIP